MYLLFDFWHNKLELKISKKFAKQKRKYFWESNFHTQFGQNIFNTRTILFSRDKYFLILLTRHITWNLECNFQGMRCEGACKIHSLKCPGCACVELVFGSVMFDLTFTHFWNKIARKCYSITSYSVIEHLFLLVNIIFCFWTSYFVLEHPKIAKQLLKKY